MDSSNANRQTQPAIIIIVGAVIAAASTALVWMKLEAPDTETVEAKGLDLDAGSFCIVAAVVAVILAIVQLTRGAKGKGRGQAIANIVMAALIIAMAVWVLAAPGDVFAAQAADDVASQFGISEGLAEEAIKQGIDDGEVDVTSQLGVFGALAGGLIALVGSIMGLRAAPKTVTGAPSTGASLGGQQAVPPQQPPTPDTQDTARRLGAEGPGTTGPGTPQVGGSTPTDATGSTEPPPGNPSGGQAPPR